MEGRRDEGTSGVFRRYVGSPIRRGASATAAGDRRSPVGMSSGEDSGVARAGSAKAHSSASPRQLYDVKERWAPRIWTCNARGTGRSTRSAGPSTLVYDTGVQTCRRGKQSWTPCPGTEVGSVSGEVRGRVGRRRDRPSAKSRPQGRTRHLYPDRRIPGCWLPHTENGAEGARQSLTPIEANPPISFVPCRTQCRSSPTKGATRPAGRGPGLSRDKPASAGNHGTPGNYGDAKRGTELRGADVWQNSRGDGDNRYRWEAPTWKESARLS